MIMSANKKIVGDVWDLCVIGAGPAGLIAAAFAAEKGKKVTVIEQNAIAGKKLLITGSKRCNVTHQASPKDFVKAFADSGKFLSYCLYEFSSEALQKLLQKAGLETITQVDGCVFPKSNRASDVRDCLVTLAKKNGVTFIYNRAVKSVAKKKATGFKVEITDGILSCEKLILATGGKSYPKTGSNGSGFQLAKSLGHKVTEPVPSLVPLVTEQAWPKTLAGLAVGDVKIAAVLNGKTITATGAVIFTHQGIGGPAIMNFSRFVTRRLAEGKPIDVTIDYLRHVSGEKLQAKIDEAIKNNGKKSIAGIIAEFVPKKLAAVICQMVSEKKEKTANASEVSKKCRAEIVRNLKAAKLKIIKTAPLDGAIMTKGGIEVSEINQKTMESKICQGLFFAGEIIDVDGPCGGYNLQMCFSTAAIAGQTAAKT